jgi:hypothetical protein
VIHMAPGTAAGGPGLTWRRGPGSGGAGWWRETGWGSVWSLGLGFGYTAKARVSLLARRNGVWGNWQPDGFWPR